MATSAAIVTGFPNLGDGSVSQPSLAFQSDSDTGLYKISDGKIGITTNGAKVGEIGVGYGGFTGNIIQVVSKQATGNINTASTTYQVMTSITTSITPKFNNSKILVIFTYCYGANCVSIVGYGWNGIRRTLSGVDTTILEQRGLFDGRAGQIQWSTPLSTIYLDSPATINTIDYKLIVKNDSTNPLTDIYINNLSTDNLYCTLLEVMQ